MKLISKPAPRCDCQVKAFHFQQASRENWPVGTIVQCDCGKFVTLIDDQREGLIWSYILTRDAS